MATTEGEIFIDSVVYGFAYGFTYTIYIHNLYCTGPDLSFLGSGQFVYQLPYLQLYSV